MKKVLIFSDTQDVYDYIKDTNPEGRSHETREGSFCPFSWEETISALLNGWRGPEVEIGREIADKIYEGLLKTQSLYFMQYDVTGDCIDIGAFLAGQTECWQYTEAQSVPARELRVGVSITYPYLAKSHAIINRGAAIAAFIDIARKMYDVKVIFNVCVKRGGGLDNDYDISFEMETKNLYSIDLLFFMCAHPGVLRKIVFAMEEKIENKSDCGSYGYCVFDHTPQGLDVWFPTDSDINEKYGDIKSSIENISLFLNRLKEREG